MSTAANDQELRNAAAKRKPLIAKWASDIPAGYIHSDDTYEYMKRRWGSALTTERLEKFFKPEFGPCTLAVTGEDEHGRKKREYYYAFDEIDMWVYRTLTGVPASWRETLGRTSTMPVRELEHLPEYEQREMLQMLGENHKETPHA